MEFDERLSKLDNPIMAIRLYKFIVAEYSIEKSGKGGFELDNDYLKECYQIVKKVITDKKDELSQYKRAEGADYKDGMYGYFVGGSSFFEGESGF